MENINSNNSPFTKTNNGLDPAICLVVDGAIESINSILEKKEKGQTKLNKSQIKELKNEISGLMEIGKEYFSRAESKEEKEQVIENILVVIKILFKELDINKVFSSHPVMSLDSFSNLSINNKLLNLSVPKTYRNNQLKSVKGGNCHMHGPLLYYDIIRTIIGNDKDISFSFFLNEKDSHGSLGINDSFLIDTSLENFLVCNGKEVQKGYLYALKEDEKLEELVENCGEFYSFSNVDKYIQKRNELPISDKIGVILGGKERTTIHFREKFGLTFVYLKNKGELNTIIAKNNGNKKGHSLDNLKSISKKTGKYNENTFGYLFSKINLEYLEKIIDGKNIFTIKIPKFIIKILENPKIFIAIKKLFS